MIVVRTNVVDGWGCSCMTGGGGGGGKDATSSGLVCELFFSLHRLRCWIQFEVVAAIHTSIIYLGVVIFFIVQHVPIGIHVLLVCRRMVTGGQLRCCWKRVSGIYLTLGVQSTTVTD